MYIQALENVMSNTSKVFVDTKSSNNMMYLPLDQMIRRNTVTGGRDGSGDTAAMSGQVDIQSLTDEVLRELRTRQTTNSRTGR